MAPISAEKILSSARALIEFINCSPSPYHVVDNCRKRLLSAGFEEISEKNKWCIEKGGKYFFSRNQSTLIAFAVGCKYETGNGFSMVGAHTDSPCLKLKPVSKKFKSDYLSVGVQCYGGGIWSTWFDRDLTVAGRVMVKNDNIHLDHRLVHVHKPILRIPMICIHLQRDLNDSFSINKETNTTPIIATKAFEDQLNETSKIVSCEEKSEGGKEATKHHSVLVNLICEQLGCKIEQLMDLDLVLADTQPGAIGGVYDEFIFAPRLDNLFNTFCSLQAMIESSEEGLMDETNIRLIALYDNEEVGSESAQGAASNLTEMIMRRICNCLGGNFEQCVANSYLISADQSHAVHPNYADKHEDNHKPMFHKGPVLKINCNQRYATTAVTASVLKVIADHCDVPLQEVVVRNDSGCGSTIGPILSAKLGVRTIDIGGPQLSMHSIREMGCTSSVEQTIVLLRTFFQLFPKINSTMNVE